MLALLRNKIVVTGLALGALLMAAGASRVTGEDKDDASPPQAPKDSQDGKSEEAGPDRTRDGYDRGIDYLRIRFGPRRDGEGQEGGGNEQPTRVYLVDTSKAMAENVLINEEEVSRLDHMRKLLGASLDGLSRRPGLQFNLITFGTIKDFSDGGELQAANSANTRRAKEWLLGLKAEGESDLYAILEALFKHEPGSATMLVGSMPAPPASIPADELAKYDALEDFLVTKVRVWRAQGRKTTLDITGIGLDAEARKFYQRLAQAGGGTYLDG